VDDKSVWFWHPWLVSSWWRSSGPTGPSIDRQSVSDGGKTNSSPGRARHKPLKPLRRESRAFRRTCGPPCALLCARLRVSWAPGFPCALSLERVSSTHHFGRNAPRDRNVVSSRCPFHARRRARSNPQSRCDAASRKRRSRAARRERAVVVEVVAAVAISTAHGLPLPWARPAAAPRDLSSPAAAFRAS